MLKVGCNHNTDSRIWNYPVIFPDLLESLTQPENKSKLPYYPEFNCRLTTDITGVRSQTDVSWLINKLYGKNHWCANYLNSLCLADHEFLRHLSEQTPAYLHYVCLVHLAWRKNDTAIHPIYKQAQLLRTTNQKTLLSLLYSPYPLGLLNVLPKLGANTFTKNDYLRLIKLLRDPEKSPYILHVKSIKPYQLQWLEDFPSELHWRVLYSVKKTQNYAALKYLVKVIQKLDKSRYADALISLKRIKTLSQLENWFRRHTQSLPFPQPPWNGNDWIVPIRTVKALREAALKYRNCLYDYPRQVLLGEYYFYEVKNGPAIVAIVRDPIIGWRISEINGIDNQEPDENLVTRIERAFADVNFSVEKLNDIDRLWDGNFSMW
jgi:hypothetical protein